MELGLALILCGAGVLFWIPAIVCTILIVRRTKYCTSDNIAVVTDIEVSGGSDDMSFHPVYEYQVSGQTYTGRGGYWSNHVPKVGSQVEIKYDPEHPKKSYILNYDLVIYKILALVFGIIGIIPILVCIGIAIFA